ncbi:MAG: hypothetical protein ACREBU_00580 [Nitrososphaera sp.]
MSMTRTFRRRAVEPDALALPVGGTVYVRFLSEPRQSARSLTGDAVGDENRKPATIASCINLETGEECVLILGVVLLGKLQRGYPDGIAGHDFEIVKAAEKTGSYYRYTVYEISAEEFSQRHSSDAGGFPSHMG